VAPSRVGSLDTNSHHVAYDEQRAWLCSDPEPIDFLNSTNLIEVLRGRLEADARPLREKISELVEQINSDEHRAAARAAEKRAAQYGEPIGTVPPMAAPRSRVPTTPPIPIRPSRTLSDPERQLREVADTAARVFDVQLIIVQPAGLN
jgi:hypothetical protein